MEINIEGIIEIRIEIVYEIRLGAEIVKLDETWKNMDQNLRNYRTVYRRPNIQIYNFLAIIQIKSLEYTPLETSVRSPMAGFYCEISSNFLQSTSIWHFLKVRLHYRGNQLPA